MGNKIYFLALLLLSLHVQPSKAETTVQLFTTPLTTDEAGEGLLDLERRIRRIDSSFVSVAEDIEYDRISKPYSFVLNDQNGRTYAAVLAITNPEKPGRINDVVFLMDPLHDRSQT
ncbi:MAG: hypothetical protein KDD37_06405, partial [Bdellovibrionales bacterium]|nr:hypothetical protein [Bdellovibrionales bacterium]